jgi:hypothetical protein
MEQTDQLIDTASLVFGVEEFFVRAYEDSGFVVKWTTEKTAHEVVKFCTNGMDGSRVDVLFEDGTETSAVGDSIWSVLDQEPINALKLTSDSAREAITYSRLADGRRYVAVVAADQAIDGNGLLKRSHLMSMIKMTATNHVSGLSELRVFQVVDRALS